MGNLWIASPKAGRGNFMIAGAVGIVCPGCGVKLRVLQTNVQIGVALVFLLPLGLAILLAYFDPFYKDEVKAKASLFVLLVIYLSGFFLLNRMSPRLLRLRFLKDGEQVGFPLEVVARIHKEEAQFIQEQLDRESPDVGQPSWICPNCHEENPGNFDECWKCQTWRNQASGNPSEKTG
jgi:hypothetical protein